LGRRNHGKSSLHRATQREFSSTDQSHRSGRRLDLSAMSTEAKPASVNFHAVIIYIASRIGLFFGRRSSEWASRGDPGGHGGFINLQQRVSPFPYRVKLAVDHFGFTRDRRCDLNYARSRSANRKMRVGTVIDRLWVFRSIYYHPQISYRRGIKPFPR